MSIYKIMMTSLGLLMGVPLLIGTLIYWTLPDVKYLMDNNPKTTAFIELRRAEASQKNIPFNLSWDFIPFNEISPYLISYVITMEDPAFWIHHGIRWEIIPEVLVLDWREKRFKYGGSTITQQLAKNLFLSPSKTFIRKIRECFIALALEHYLSKKRILELYLNIVELGDGIFGVEAASQRLFKTTALKLTPSSAAYLITRLPSPRKELSKEYIAEINLKINQLISNNYPKKLLPSK